MRTWIRLSLGLGVVAIVGCAAFMPGSGQPMPGAIASSSALPVALVGDQEFQAYPDRYEILGSVDGSASNYNVLGLFTFGNGGLIRAREQALQKRNADGLISPAVDVKSRGLLFLFARSTTVVRGVAVKRR